MLCCLGSTLALALTSYCVGTDRMKTHRPTHKFRCQAMCWCFKYRTTARRDSHRLSVGRFAMSSSWISVRGDVAFFRKGTILRRARRLRTVLHAKFLAANSVWYSHTGRIWLRQFLVTAHQYGRTTIEVAGGLSLAHNYDILVLMGAAAGGRA
ncbi:hypothetical protein BS17DRAFT_776030 [Gyrodon lividus]|nr:hypothetical protein BS17DRAFT_776030 [Gyrodon lividus]